MQQKRIIAKPGRLVALAVVALAFAFAGLMRTHIPAQQKPVERELDAKAFLDSGQQ